MAFVCCRWPVSQGSLFTDVTKISKNLKLILHPSTQQFFPNPRPNSLLYIGATLFNRFSPHWHSLNVLLWEGKALEMGYKLGDFNLDQSFCADLIVITPKLWCTKAQQTNWDNPKGGSEEFDIIYWKDLKHVACYFISWLWRYMRICRTRKKPRWRSFFRVWPRVSNGTVLCHIESNLNEIGKSRSAPLPERNTFYQQPTFSKTVTNRALSIKLILSILLFLRMANYDYSTGGHSHISHRDFIAQGGFGEVHKVLGPYRRRLM